MDMRQNIFLFTSMVAFLSVLTACTDESQDIPQTTTYQTVMTTLDFEIDTDSRTSFLITQEAVKSTWNDNDTVGVFPNEGAQVYFPMVSGAGTQSASFSGGGWALKDGNTYAAYFPFISNYYLNQQALPVYYDGQKQSGNASTEHLSKFDYMAAKPEKPQYGLTNFTFRHLGALVALKVIIPSASTLHSLTLTAASNVFAIEGKVDITSDMPCITPVRTSNEITLQVEGITTTEVNEMVTLYLLIPPTDLSNQTLKASIKTSEGSKFTSMEGKNFQAGKAYILMDSNDDIIKEENYGAFSIIHTNLTIIAPILVSTNGMIATIHWGDDQSEPYDKDDTHTYETQGVHTISIESYGAEEFTLKDMIGIKKIDLTEF